VAKFSSNQLVNHQHQTIFFDILQKSPGLLIFLPRRYCYDQSLLWEPGLL